jgi:hypothetical protein
LFPHPHDLLLGCHTLGHNVTSSAKGLDAGWPYINRTCVSAVITFVQ